MATFRGHRAPSFFIASYITKQQADQKKLFYQLYISIVGSHMEYGGPVWYPHALQKSTQKFACKVITRNWDEGYDELLDTINLQIESCTSNCAPFTKLCTICLIFLVYLKSLRVSIDLPAAATSFRYTILPSL